MEKTREYYVNRIKELERRKNLLKTDFFDKQLAECKLQLSKLNEKDGKENVESN